MEFLRADQEGRNALVIRDAEPIKSMDDIWASLAKAEVTEAFVFIATDCVQLHGGVGFTWDYDPQIFLKRARLNEVLVMPNPALRDRAAAGLAAATRAGRSALELGL